MIPPEIPAFLDSPNRILLIKGAAGTGKTLMAVELAKAFQTQGKDVFWLASRHADPRENIDLEAVLRASRRRSAKQVPQNQEDAPTGPPTETRGATEDPSSLLRDLELDVEAPGTIAILDSIDGLWGYPRPQDIAAFVDEAKGLAERIQACFVFIAEEPGPHPADHLVDGIVQLQQEIIDGALMRSCLLQKMRGTPLQRPAYAFTLADGEFAAFVERPQERPTRLLRPSPRWGEEGWLSTANQQWDRLLGGGLARGSVHLVEYRRNAVRKVHRLTTPLTLNALAAGAHVLYFGLPRDVGTSPPQDLLPHIDRAATKRLHFIDPLALRWPPTTPTSVEERLAHVERLRRESPSTEPTVTILSIDSLHLHGPRDEVHSWLARWCATTRSLGSIDILIANEADAAAQAPLADDWWLLHRHLDAPILQGVAPRTEGHFIHWRTHKGYPESVLQPIH